MRPRARYVILGSIGSGSGAILVERGTEALLKRRGTLPPSHRRRTESASVLASSEPSQAR